MAALDQAIAANRQSAASEDFGGEAVIIHFDRGTYFSLGGSASMIWAMLQAPVTASGILDALRSAEVAVTPQFESSLMAFVSQLLEHDLVRPTEIAAPPVLPSPFEPAIFAQAPTIEIFTDLAELIALDPVHEVDALEGWPFKLNDASKRD